MGKAATGQGKLRQAKAWLRRIQHYEQITHNASQTCRFFGVSRRQVCTWLNRVPRTQARGTEEPQIRVTQAPSRHAAASGRPIGVPDELLESHRPAGQPSSGSTCFCQVVFHARSGRTTPGRSPTQSPRAELSSGVSTMWNAAACLSKKCTRGGGADLSPASTRTAPAARWFPGIHAVLM